MNDATSGERRTEQTEQPNTLHPWEQPVNENTRRDLNRYVVDQLLSELEQAQQNPKYPKALDEVKTLFERFQVAMFVIDNATLKQPKHRNKLEKLYLEAEAKIEAVAAETGFNLRDKSTW